MMRKEWLFNFEKELSEFERRKKNFFEWFEQKSKLKHGKIEKIREKKLRIKKC